MKATAPPSYTFDEFLLRRMLIAEYTAHRVLARHGPYERCTECIQILETFNARTEGQPIALSPCTPPPEGGLF